MSGIDAVCFDLDGTLCVSAQDRDRLLSDAFADVGIDPAFDLADLWAVDTSSLPTAESSFEFHRNLFGAGARQTGETLSQGTIESLTDAYLARYDPAAVEPRDGALDALADGRRLARGRRRRRARSGDAVGLGAEYRPGRRSGADADPRPRLPGTAIDAMVNSHV